MFRPAFFASDDEIAERVAAEKRRAAHHAARTEALANAATRRRIAALCATSSGEGPHLPDLAASGSFEAAHRLPQVRTPRATDVAARGTPYAPPLECVTRRPKRALEVASVPFRSHVAAPDRQKGSSSPSTAAPVEDISAPAPRAGALSPREPSTTVVVEREAATHNKDAAPRRAASTRHYPPATPASAQQQPASALLRPRVERVTQAGQPDFCAASTTGRCPRTASRGTSVGGFRPVGSRGSFFQKPDYLPL